MPLMPPSDFVASATQKGFIFSVKPGGALGVKPPPGGSLTDPMRRYVSVMKSELLALLQNADALLSRSLTKPDISRELEQAESPHQLAEVGAVYQLAAVVSWALSESRRGLLPELAESLTLPSGQVCPADGAAAWLIAAESRSAGLAHHSATSVDCALALAVVQRDMKALALWARHARLSSVRGPRVCCLESSGMQ